ncbi:hypothetical protein M409DRAFT_28634 [Zasmidium cellare ATCC 36951]|uniref:2EXR domain-containing protein n=1 Tax=Zasmidium cellare ATCC 36951 TaxID=1080233 RepID=A0A6A6C1U0_ZASCE|nr:uncharacterized protein M409DRAFT_28634 [Zasmidium cellare ATCC 36951]KAF2161027.1 hypothetical protein M409DRAFT_28634 [Zasmidium cellare ATCC 36951]
MDKSPFNKLPAELRNRIYEFALADDISIDARSEEPIVYEDLTARLAVTETCKQVRQEALPIFYSSCHNFYTPILEDWPEDEQVPFLDEFVFFLGAWLKKPNPYLNQLRRVRVHCSAWHANDERDDVLVRILPLCIREIQNVLAGTRARLELCFRAQCNDFGEPQTGIPICVNPQDLPGSLKEAEIALQNEQSLIKGAQDLVAPEVTAEDIERLKYDLQRTRRIMGKFFDVLEATDVKT